MTDVEANGEPEQTTEPTAAEPAAAPAAPPAPKPKAAPKIASRGQAPVQAGAKPQERVKVPEQLMAQWRQANGQGIQAALQAAHLDMQAEKLREQIDATRTAFKSAIEAADAIERRMADMFKLGIKGVDWQLDPQKGEVVKVERPPLSGSGGDGSTGNGPSENAG